MSGDSVPTAVLIASSFAREGIRSYLEDSVFRIAEICSFSDEYDEDEPPLIISTPQDVIQSEAIRNYISSNADAKLVLLCEADSLKYLPVHVIRSTIGILDCEIDRKTLINALELVMSGIAVRSSKLMEFVINLDPNSTHQFQLGNGHFSADVRTGSASLQGQPNTKPLSPAEIKVLKCLAEGSSNKVIALRHCLAEATVKIHVKHILRKLNAQNRTQAAIWARENSVHLHSS